MDRPGTAELPEDAVDRDQLLTNVSIYWFTGTAASRRTSSYEGMQAGGDGRARRRRRRPAARRRAVAVFDADPIVRRLMDPAGAIAHWSEFDRGGHFAAMEVPDLLVDDVRAFFRGLR